MFIATRAREGPPTSQHPAAGTALPPSGNTNAYLDLLCLMLDEVDYGLLLLDRHGAVLHLNHAASNALRGAHPLRLGAQRLLARSDSDQRTLRQAMDTALLRGQRCMVCLGGSDPGAHISVVPLVPDAQEGAAVLVVLGRLCMVSPLAVQSLARSHGLSPSEGRVLGSLCAGYSPLEIAAQHGVKLDTVRSQISQVRAKTGVGSIRELIRQAACLPPMIDILQQRGADPWLQPLLVA